MFSKIFSSSDNPWIPLITNYSCSLVQCMLRHIEYRILRKQSSILNTNECQINVIQSWILSSSLVNWTFKTLKIVELLLRNDWFGPHSTIDPRKRSLDRLVYLNQISQDGQVDDVPMSKSRFQIPPNTHQFIWLVFSGVRPLRKRSVLSWFYWRIYPPPPSGSSTFHRILRKIKHRSVDCEISSCFVQYMEIIWSSVWYSKRGMRTLSILADGKTLFWFPQILNAKKDCRF